MLHRIIINCDQRWPFVDGVRSHFLDLYREQVSGQTLFWDVTRQPASATDFGVWGDWPEQMGANTAAYTALRAAILEEIADTQGQPTANAHFVLFFLVEGGEDMLSKTHIGDEKMGPGFLKAIRQDLSAFGRDLVRLVLVLRKDEPGAAYRSLLNFVDHITLLENRYQPILSPEQGLQRNFDTLRAVLDLYGSQDGWKRILSPGTHLQHQRSQCDRILLPSQYKKHSHQFRQTVLASLQRHYDRIWSRAADSPTAEQQQPARIKQFQQEISGIFSALANIEEIALQPLAPPNLSDHLSSCSSGQAKLYQKVRTASRLFAFKPMGLATQIAFSFLDLLGTNIQQRMAQFREDQSRRLAAMNNSTQQISRHLQKITVSQVGVGDPVLAVVQQAIRDLAQKETEIADKITAVHALHQDQPAQGQRCHDYDTRLSEAQFKIIQACRLSVSQFQVLQKQWHQANGCQAVLPARKPCQLLLLLTGALCLLPGIIPGLVFTLREQSSQLPVAAYLLGSGLLLLLLLPSLQFFLHQSHKKRKAAYQQALGQLEQELNDLAKNATQQLAKSQKYHNYVKVKQCALQTRHHLEAVLAEVAFSKDYMNNIGRSLSDQTLSAETVKQLAQPVALAQVATADWMQAVLKTMTLPAEESLYFRFHDAEASGFKSRYFSSGMGEIVIEPVIPVGKTP